MTTDRDNAVRNVLWVIGDRENGWQPGGFATALLEAWAHADHYNDMQLRAAFPALGEAVAASKRGGRDALLVMLSHG